MVMTNKDCEELEKQLETLKFRNEVLHKANQKQQDEILDLRTKVKKLEHDAVQQFRNEGDM
jgi:chaperonin cofactor prefoldin